MKRLERIVILSVSAGTGHMRAAAAIKAAVLEENPAAEITILDTFKYTSPLLEKVVLGTYMELLRITPVVYGYLYRKAERGQPLSGFMKTEFTRILNKVIAHKLVLFLKYHDPQVVICTHPFPLGVMSALRTKGQVDIPLVAALTDFTIHPFWVFDRVDYYLVAAEELRYPFEKYGVDLNRVIATGIPIDPNFSVNPDLPSLQAKLGLASNISTALIMGGGLGMGPVAEVVEALGSGKAPVQLLVVAGNNNTLRQNLEQMAGTLPNTTKVFGFVDNIDELMTVADFLVGKAGGLTCAEAMARGLPVFICDPLPGQEERNAEFLVSAGAALRVTDATDLTDALRSVLERPELLREMSKAASILGKPQAARAARDVIKLALSSHPADFKVAGNNYL